MADDAEADDDGSVASAGDAISALLRGETPKVETVRKKAAVKAEKPPAEKPAVEGDDADDEPLEADDDDDESVKADDEQESDAEDDQDSEDAEDDDEEPKRRSVDDVAKQLKIEPKALLDTLELKVKVDGKVETVTLAELQKGYSREADYRAKTAELGNKGRAFEQWRSKTEKDTVTAAQTLHHVFTSLHEAFVGKAPDVTLLNVDPDAFTREKVARDARQEAFNGLLGPVLNTLTEADGKRKHAMGAHQAAQHKALQGLVPELFDSKHGAARQRDLNDFLAKDYSPQELASLVDARTTKHAWQSMQYEKLKSGEALKEKKEKAKTKAHALRSGNGADPKADRRTLANQALGRLRKSGSIDDAAAAIGLRFGAKR